MWVYLVRRLLPSALVLLVVTFLSFWAFAARIDPLTPLRMETPYPKERIAQITKREHLNDPIVSRYVRWLRGIVSVHGARHTILEREPIWPPVWQSLKTSAQLVAATLVVVALFSIALGTIAAYRRGTAVDAFLRGLGYLVWSIPVFLFALMIQQIVYHVADSTGSLPLPPNGLPHGHGLAYVADWFRHMVLPVAALSASYIGVHSRYVRSSLLVALATPYATVARAKGLKEQQVVLRHALRNSLIPFVAVLALDFGALFGASFVVDWIFRLNGIGALWVHVVGGYDPYQVEAVLAVTALAVVAFSFLSDVLLGVLDPRVRLT